MATTPEKTFQPKDVAVSRKKGKKEKRKKKKNPQKLHLKKAEEMDRPKRRVNNTKTKKEKCPQNVSNVCDPSQNYRKKNICFSEILFNNSEMHQSTTKKGL